MVLKKLKIIFLVLASVLIIMLFIRGSRAPYVSISGRVVYDQFVKGDIELYWTSILNIGGPPDPRFQQGLTYLAKPGPYRLKVPRNFGNIYICARNKGSMHESFAYFISEPISIGLEDLNRYDIVLKPNKLLMDDYQGPTVKLSGEVSCRNCEKGKISVCVYSQDWYGKVRLPPDIAKTSLKSPGDFSLEVPQGSGKICLLAVSIPEGEKSGNSPRSLQASYPDNPLTVTDKDINGLQIIIN